MPQQKHFHSSSCYTKVVRKFRRYQLKVISTLLSNFVVLWLGFAIFERKLLILTADIVLAIVCLYFAFLIEKGLEEYDRYQ